MCCFVFVYLETIDFGLVNIDLLNVNDNLRMVSDLQPTIQDPNVSCVTIPAANHGKIPIQDPNTRSQYKIPIQDPNTSCVTIPTTNHG